jgi:hypothetical protein
MKFSKSDFAFNQKYSLPATRRSLLFFILLLAKKIQAVMMALWRNI